MECRVFVAACPDYAQAEEKTAELIERMGGMGRFARPGETLLLKANLLAAAGPEQAVSTHPAVVGAAAKLVAGQGARAVIGDSPGGPYLESGLRHLYEKTGMRAAAEASGAALNYDVSTRQISLPEGKVLHSAQVIAPAVESDGILNLCKLKTHLFMSMTGAVKNHFGLIPGVTKVGFHASHQDKGQFADMLLDLALWAAPRLNLMDAVLAMEGEGPGASGTPRPVGLLLASENPLALDIVAGEIIGLPRLGNPVLLAAQRRGLPSRIEEVELVGAGIDALRIPDYRFPAHVRTNIREFLGPLTGPASRLAKSWMAQTPQIRPERCVGCGICKNACPAGAITLEAHRARIDSRNCIHCYCCHELCPQKAVALKQGALSRLFQSQSVHRRRH